MSRPVCLPDPVVHKIWAARGRLICNRSLGAMGFDSSRIAGWVRGGVLERLAPGWYRLPGDEAPWQRHHLAVSYLTRLQPSSPAMISGAAGLLAAGCQVIPSPQPTVLVRAGRQVRVAGRPFTVVQRRHLERVVVERHQGLPVACPACAIADLMHERALSDRDVRAVLYRLLNDLRIAPAELVEVWRTMDHAGAKRLLGLAAQGALQHESPAEYDLFQEVFRPFPPPPDCQVVLAPNIRVDFVYLFAALVIEYYGEEAHADSVDKDGTRIYSLRELGFDVLVVTKSMTRTPARLAQFIHSERRHREQLILRGELRSPAVPAQPGRLMPLRTMTPGG
ncbi:MAG: hypothetical protein ACR2HR_10175 [Euzebya sp.]